LDKASRLAEVGKDGEGTARQLPLLPSRRHPRAVGLTAPALLPDPSKPSPASCPPPCPPLLHHRPLSPLEPLGPSQALLPFRPQLQPPSPPPSHTALRCRAEGQSLPWVRQLSQVTGGEAGISGDRLVRALAAQSRASL